MLGLQVPTINFKHAERNFAHICPTVLFLILLGGIVFVEKFGWNHIPAAIEVSPSLDSFERHLKTHYFTSP